MREIKFKAYWNDSCYVGWSVPFTLLDIRNGQVMADRDDEGPDYEPLSLAKAIVEFTGLSDRNGAEIYEGDLFYYPWHGDPVLRVVEYYGCGFVARDALDHVIPMEYLTALPGKWEVTGNIYDNPELVNGQS